MGSLIVVSAGIGILMMFIYMIFEFTSDKKVKKGF